jgi:hypothetical protein
MEQPGAYIARRGLTLRGTIHSEGHAVHVQYQSNTSHVISKGRKFATFNNISVILWRSVLKREVRNSVIIKDVIKYLHKYIIQT